MPNLLSKWELNSIVAEYSKGKQKAVFNFSSLNYSIFCEKCSSVHYSIEKVFRDGYVLVAKSHVHDFIYTLKYFRKSSCS